MKPKKLAKRPRPLWPADIVLDAPAENPPDDGRSLLRRVDGRDAEIQQQQARSRAAEVFLQTRLFPLAARRQSLDEQTLVDLLVEFKGSRARTEPAFEMAQVTARMLSRFQHYLLDDETEGRPPAVSDALRLELELLQGLARLDFQHIDEQVQARLHFA